MAKFITVVERGNAVKIDDSLIAGFEMFEYPITCSAWDDIADWANEHGYYLDSNFTGNTEGDGNLPNAYVTWIDAILWCNAASEKFGREPVYLDENDEVLRSKPDDIEDYDSVDETGIKQNRLKTCNGFRLPSCNEWEVAARGGDPLAPDWNYVYAGSNDLDKVGWYGGDNGNADGLRQVGQLKPNRLGLYDMSGNVAEICTNGETKGGGWATPADWCTVDNINVTLEPWTGGEGHIGFRPVRTLLVETEEQALNFVGITDVEPGIRSVLLFYVPEALRTEKVCLAAVKKSEKAMQYVPEALKARIAELLKNGDSAAAAPQAATPAAAAAPVEPPAAPAVPPPLPGAPAWQNLPPVQYYVGLNGQQAGPFDWAELDSLIKKGGMNSQTLVWKAGFANWTPASDAPELKVLFG